MHPWRIAGGAAGSWLGVSTQRPLGGSFGTVKDRLRTMPRRTALALGAVMLALPFGLGACAAIYPELGTRIDKVTADQKLDPPPPDGLRWLQFEKGEVPPTTRDGRKWGRGIQDGLPDAVAKLFVNDVEVLKTDPAP